MQIVEILKCARNFRGPHINILSKYSHGENTECIHVGGDPEAQGGETMELLGTWISCLNFK